MSKSLKLTGIFSVLFFISESSYSQIEKYTYSLYQQDWKTASKIQAYCNTEQFDSAAIYLNTYKNRLGFTYYKFQAIVLKGKNNPLFKYYLDSAFRTGMSPACLMKQKKMFDSTYLWQSYSKNYLKAYDLQLINSLDSMRQRDQLYRSQFITKEGIKNYKQFKKKGIEGGNESVPMEDAQEIKRKDSLTKLQNPIDSSNREFLSEIIRTKGWPSAKLIGWQYCQKSPPSPWLLIVHTPDLDQNRKLQSEMVKNLIPLCEKNEESWSNVEQYVWSVHNRSRKNFHEFSFIFFKNDTLDREASYLSCNQMAESVIKNCTERMEIKCKNEAQFVQIRDYLIVLGAKFNLDALNHIYKMESWPLPKHPTPSDFEFIPAPNFLAEQVEFRFIPL